MNIELMDYNENYVTVEATLGGRFRGRAHHA